MAFFKRQPSPWLREMAAIFGAVLVTCMPATTARANTDNDVAFTTATASTPLTVGQLPTPGFCPSDLDVAIDAIVNRPQFATANWGISVKPLSDETVLYSHDSEAFLVPASNIKLLTTAAAVQIITERSPRALSAFREQLEVINRHSNNARADALLRTIGGQHAVRAALSSLGVNPDSYRQADGSGLSRSNLAKPSTFVTLLKAMHEADASRIFYNSLPISGVNGTLEHRFKGTSVQGKVHAKTGTLNGVRALSGYLETADYGTVIFSIVVNQPGQSGRVLLQAIDEMVLHIGRVEPCR